MKRLTAATGLLAVLVLAWHTDALHPDAEDNTGWPLWRQARSVDVNEVYELSMQQQKLPTEVVPLRYHLQLEPDIAAGTYEGRVNITVLWKEMTDGIMFNAGPGLLVKECSVTMQNHMVTNNTMQAGSQLSEVRYVDLNVARVEKSASRRRPWYTIQLEQMVTSDSIGNVLINFSGNLATNETSGFFKSQYMDSERKMHPFIATANLRLYNARNVFPCMDEPSQKAEYKVSILRSKDMVALSNMPVESTVEEPSRPGMVWDHFAQSPRMSTFQLALIVSDLESLQPTLQVNEINGGRLQVAVWARKEYLRESLSEVPNKVVRIINYLQDYFNSSIYLPKLDIVAVPMYNTPKPSDSWGLMFFKESELSSSSVWNTAYEIVYQWIGQSITPSSWTAAPINKALNSFLASMTTIDIDPDEMEGKWPMTMLYSLYYEYSKAVPFSIAAGFRNEATSAKTELTFRMFNYTLGRELFREGVRSFVHEKHEERNETNTHKNRTFLEGDIYSRLNEVADKAGILPEGLTIDGIARPWIHRERIPLVTAIRDYGNKTITLTLKEYLRERPKTESRMRDQWDIPLVMIPEESLDFHYTRPSAWLTKGNGIFGSADKPGMHWVIDDPSSPDKILIINPEEIGMFLVNYDTTNWVMLAKFLQGPDRERIPVLTRAKLLHDSWNLAYADEQSFAVALDMTLFLRQERSHVVWQPVFTMIDHVGGRIEGTDVYEEFVAYIITLLQPLYAELGESAQPGEPFWKVHMRGLVKNFLCRHGHDECIKEARKQYNKWMTDDEPDKGNPVANEFLCPVFKSGTDEEWEFGLQRVINFPRDSIERKQSERTYLLKTLASCPTDTHKIERLLNVSVLDENGNFTDSDIRLIFSMLTSSSAGYNTLFNFLKTNWDAIRQRFKNKDYLWNSIVHSATSPFRTEPGLELVSELYRSHPDEFGSAECIIHESLELIGQEMCWSVRNLPVIHDWLMKHLPEDNAEGA